MGLRYVVADADGMEVDPAEALRIPQIDRDRERFFAGQLKDEVDALIASGGIHQVGHEPVYQEPHMPSGLILIDTR